MIGNAAALISESEHIKTWLELKTILLQHFGDQRSEDCILMELEVVTIKSDETFLPLCHRILIVRSNLFSKVNQCPDKDVRENKYNIYNHIALTVFLYNLPKGLMRIVR
ncbi:hypothetical protein JYU34_015194 [Plutella xylostella]|uniref:BTB domain-containing protein n=1 Tax=Plutella xylostella TaxID=51655 RepID=A0ABQ7Q6J0_PLUXY|nr:hypothetical protein JYU34_015194 [Plutella xylostella]